MSNKYAFILAIHALLSSGLFAQNRQALVPAGDETYDLVRALSFASGVLPLSMDAPQSLDRLMNSAAEAGEAASTAPALAAAEDYLAGYAAAQPLTGPIPLSFKAKLKLSPEFYLKRADTALPAFFGYETRSGIFSFPLELGIKDLFALGADLRFGLNPDSVDPSLAPQPWTNLPVNPDYIDNRYPRSSYVAVGGDFFSLRAARSPVDWGPAQNNLYLSESADFLDHLYADIALEDFSYAFLAASLDSREEGGKSSQLPDASENVLRTLFLHRLQARFFKRARLSIMEGAMVGKVEPDIRYLIPLNVFHSFFDFEHSTSYSGIELEVLPWKYASLYLSAVSNQITSSYERQRYPTSAVIPDAFAWQAGSRAYLPAGPGLLELRAEFTYANPWMYIREYPSVSYSNEHYLCSNVPGSSQYDFPCLGFSSGPDSVLSLFEVGYRLPGKLLGVAGLQYLRKGEKDLDSVYEQSLEAAALVSPSGISEDSLRLHLSGSYRFLPGLSLKLGGAFISVRNANHVPGDWAWDLQGIAGIELEAFELYRFLKGSLPDRRLP